MEQHDSSSLSASIRPHQRHHASRSPLAVGATMYPVQAVYARKQVPSPYAPSYLAHTCIPCRLAAHHDLSICRFRAADYSAIWITQLRHFRPFDLELAAILPLTILDSTLTGFLKLNCIGLTEHYGGHTAPS